MNDKNCFLCLIPWMCNSCPYKEFEMNRQFKTMYDSFDEAFACWASQYIYDNGFKAFMRLPKSKQHLRILMFRDGYLCPD